MIKQLDITQKFAVSGGASVPLSASTIGTAIGAFIGGLFSLTKCVQPAQAFKLESVVSTQSTNQGSGYITRYHYSSHNMLGVICGVAGMLASGLIKIAHKR